MVYRSQFDLHPMFAAPLATKMKTAVARPFVLLFKEMIVLLMSLYAAFIYGCLYLFFVSGPCYDLSASLSLTFSFEFRELSLSSLLKTADGRLESRPYPSSESDSE